MDKDINNNGYEFVDLGLPSGTLWATMNVGASKPEDFGLYFQWGDTIGYTYDQVGKDKNFNWDGYKWYSGGTFTKYTTTGASLDLEDDAAHAYMGGDWHMPTDEQIQELIDNTKGEWFKFCGVNGMKFTSKEDSSKFIFIPAAGDVWDGLVGNSGRYGYIWSSTMSAYDFIYGKYFNFCLEDIYVGIVLRYYGLPIRGVIDKKQYDSKVNKENEAMTDKNNSLKAYDDEIASLQERIKEIEKKKSDCLTNDYSKMYVGKYVKITRKDLPHIKECIYVRNVYVGMNSGNLILTLQGQGFCYSAGDYLDEIEGNFSETHSKTIYENWIIDGLVKVDIISKEEYKKEVKKMIDFISKDFDDVEITSE